MSSVLLSYDNLQSKGINYSKIQLRRKERVGTFPQRVQLSPSRVAWVESEIDEWIAQYIAARQQAPAQAAA
jgi:prophage regulatory protein